MSRRPSPILASQYTQVLRERDELEARFKKASNELADAKLKIAELEALAEGRKKVALEALREKTKAQKQIAEWRDVRALQANDKEIQHAA